MKVWHWLCFVCMVGFVGARDKPIVSAIAHRGFGGTENTLDSIERAWVAGADIVEVDVRMLDDGELVLFHDNKLRRRSVDHLTIECLQALAREKEIATLGEALAKIPDDRSILLDLKNPSSNMVEQLTEELSNNRVSLERVLIQSKSLRIVQKIKERLPKVNALLVVSSKSNELNVSLAKVNALSAAVLESKIDGVCMKYGSYLKTEHADSFTTNNLLLFVWTVNRASKIDELIEAQVSGIITDRLDILINKIRNSREEDSALKSYSSLSDKSS